MTQFRDKSECDLLIVIGSSLKVRPVALIPSSLPPEVPQILINRCIFQKKVYLHNYNHLPINVREPLPHLTFDVELLGDCDRIVNQLCLMLADECWAPPIHSPLLSQHTGMPVIPSSSEDNTAEDFKDDENVKSSSQEQEEVVKTLTDKDNNTDCKSKNDEKENSVQGNDLTSEPSTSKNNDEHNENPNKGDESDDEGEEWKVKSLSDYIPEGQFLFLPPSRYIVHIVHGKYRFTLITLDMCFPVLNSIPILTPAMMKRMMISRAVRGMERRTEKQGNTRSSLILPVWNPRRRLLLS